jgi:class 3 adenylate cyclase/tetratricopeptide (TPR) repeat protein
MSFLQTVEMARAFLERNGRVSLRALQREFNLDGGALDELIEELVEIQRVAVRDGRALAWAGGAPPAPTETPEHERAPRDYTPKHLADKILQSKSAIEGERKQVTVLFADVKGSLELAEQVDPEAWHRILDRFFEILTDGVHRFEGTVNQYTGDGIMALFGAPIAHEDHAQRACYAALHLQDALRAYANQLRVEQGLAFAVRLGVNSGEVVVGKIGDDLRMDYTAQGLTVGLAARMQQIAEAGRTYLTGATATLVSGYFELEDLGASRVQGMREPVPVFALTGAGSMRTRLDLSRARGFSKFVGRADEMARLEAAFERALASDGQVVGIVAEAGMGKSRLCHELAERCRSQGIPVRHATGVSHGRAIPLLPILQFFRDYFGIAPTDGEREARQKIAGAAVLLDADLREDLPLLFDMLGVPDPERPLPPLDADTRRRRAVEMVKRFAVARSRREPSVLIFEDLHWVDSATDIFVEALADACEGTRTLVLFNFRPEYRADWMHRAYYQQLALRPLDEEDIGELLADWLGDHPSLSGVPERVFRHAAGNPFFVEEIVRTLIESGRLEGSRGRYGLAGELREFELPTTVQSVLAARIDRLGEREKHLLQRAAVIGNDFAASLVAEVAELPEAALADALRALVKAELLVEQALYPEVEYAFRHPLTRDVAYDSQLRERREGAHAAVARALEERHAEALDEHAALLAHHWEQAGEPLEAARWYNRAATWIGLGAPAEALRSVRRVRELLADVPDSQEVLALRLEALGWIAVHTTRLGLGEGELDAIVEEGGALLSRIDGRPDLEIGFRISIGLAYVLEGRVADAIAHGEETLSRARGLEGQNLLLMAPLIMALTFAERVDRARALVEELAGGFDTVAAFAESAMGSVVLANRGFGLTCAGRLGEAGSMLDHAIENAIAQGNLMARDVAHGYYALLERHRGFPPAALAHGRQAVELAEQVASPAGLRQALYHLGHAHLVNGDLEQAHSVLERGLATGRGRHFSVRLLSALAETLARLGEHDRARETAREAIVVANATGQPEIPAQIALARALRLGDGIESEGPIGAALERAIELIEEFGARVYRPQVCEERAELARLRGDEAARTRELREALRLYQEMGATGHAERLSREQSS